MLVSVSLARLFSVESPVGFSNLKVLNCLTVARRVVKPTFVL